MNVEARFPRLESLEQIEAEVKTQTQQEHSEALEIAESLLDTLLDGFGRIGLVHLPPDKDLERAWLLLTIRRLSFLRCAYDLCQRGYYPQAITLVRSAQEDWLTAEDCTKQWATKKDPTPRRRTLETLLSGAGQMPKFSSEMAERLPAELRDGWRERYKQTSKFAHPWRTSLRVLVRAKGLRYVSHYNSAAASYVLSSIILEEQQLALHLSQLLEWLQSPAIANQWWRQEALPIMQKLNDLNLRLLSERKSSLEH